MAGPLSSSAIFHCEGRNGGVYGELLVGYCGPGNISVIGRGSGCVLFFCELQDSEVTQGNVGLKSVGERCFGEMVSRGHEDFNEIVDVFY